jgi:hypothetical protein
MPFAGPVFTEWYWTPIFHAIVYGPPILVLAGVLYALGRFTRLRRRTRAAAALAAAPVLVLGGVAVVSTLNYRAAESADAGQVTFATFAAPDFHQTRSSVVGGRWPRLHLAYARGRGDLLVTQVAAEDDDITPPECALHDGTPHHAWMGPCRAARTPGGRVVTLADITQPSLIQIREGTLVVAGAYGGAEADLLALADALEPVAVDDVHWER